MCNKTYKQEGVFYTHGLNKWVYRTRDNQGKLVSSNLFNKWQEANDEFLKTR